MSTGAQRADLPAPVMREVAEGVYAYVQLDGSWGLNNAGAIVGGDGSLLIDTCFTEGRSRAFVLAAERVSRASRRTLVNTHHHGDHTFGNYLLPDATIVGHRLCREAMLETGLSTQDAFPGVQWGDIAVVPPFVTFDERLTVHVDDLEVQLEYYGPAHTSNDVVCHVPEHELVFAGDLVFNAGTPFVLMGSVAGSVRALERLRGLGARTIVPGHGEVCGPGVIEELIGYFELLLSQGAAAFDAGIEPLEAAYDLDLDDFAGWHDPERIVGNLHRLYAELRGAPPAAPLDYPSIRAEMVEYNGGRPLRCLA